MNFPTSPATVIIGGYTRVGVITWEQGTDIPYLVTLQAFGEFRSFAASEMTELAPGMFTGLTWVPEAEEGERQEQGLLFTIRPSVEADAIASETLSGSIPLPLDVMRELVESDGQVTMPTLWAMSDNEGFVATLMLNSASGLHVRYASAWHRLTDPDVVDGLTVTEVDDASVEMFDQFDRAGQMVALSAFSIRENPIDLSTVMSVGEVPEATPEVVESTIADVKAVPMLSSAADLEGAIAAAKDDESLQWYVERRAQALGLTVDFPWQ